MSSVDRAMSMLRLHEGFRAMPYMDTVGKMTIGYGRNLHDKGISDIEAEVLLRNDVMESAIALSKHDFWAVCNDARQAVLLDMTVNMGMGGLLTFARMLDAIRIKAWDTAADEMLSSKWSTQVGQRATELADVMRKGL